MSGPRSVLKRSVKQHEVVVELDEERKKRNQNPSAMRTAKSACGRASLWIQEERSEWSACDGDQRMIAGNARRSELRLSSLGVSHSAEMGSFPSQLLHSRCGPGVLPISLQRIWSSFSWKTAIKSIAVHDH